MLFRSDDFKSAQCVIARYYNIIDDADNFFKIVMKTVLNSVCSEICCESGSYYFKKRDYYESIYWYETAAAAEPELSIDYKEFIPNFNICRAYIELQDWTNASKFYKIAAFYKPANPDLQNLNLIIMNNY